MYFTLIDGFASKYIRMFLVPIYSNTRHFFLEVSITSSSLIIDGGADFKERRILISFLKLFNKRYHNLDASF